MYWLALYFPQLQLDSLCFIDREKKQPACVVVDRKQNILQCNTVALSAGISISMSLGTASALAEPLRFYDLDSDFQRLRLHELAQCCYQQSADIVVRDASSCLLLEVSSMLSLHGSLEAYLFALFSLLQTQDVSHTFALAETPLAAEVLARYQPSSDDTYLDSTRSITRVLGLPLQCLDIPKPVADRLLRLGLQSVNDLQALPRKDLAMKLGADLLVYLDTVLGKVATPVSFFKPLENFKRSLVFEQEVGNVKALLFPLKYALEGFESFLRERSLVAQELCIFLLDRKNNSQKISLVCAEPEAHSDVWVSLLRLKLETIELKQPVLSVVLECAHLLVLDLEHRDLFSGGKASQSANLLLSRIQARLGENSVVGLDLRSDHRPEYSFSVTQVSRSSLERKKQNKPRPGIAEQANHYAAEVSVREPMSEPAHGSEKSAGVIPKLPLRIGLRPSLLFDEPHALSESVRIIHGPERIQSAWWSDHEVCRDYFVALNTTKQRLWVFRDYEQKWFVHGLFA